MMMIIRPTVFLLVFSFFIVSPSEGDNSTQCIQYCGGRKVNRYLPSPFGFTAGCGVQLNCSKNGDIKIGEFHVHNVTADYILVNLPAKCNRPVEDLEQVIGGNYALTWRNGFLLQNCTSPSNDCFLPYSLVENRFQLQGCESKRDHISCYSEAYSGSDFMDFNNLRRTNCKVLFTSIAADLSNSSSNNSAVSLEYQTLELQWWLRGQCRCTKNTICKEFSLPDGATGFRCSCKDGFTGDGYAGGGGCRKDTSESPSGFDWKVTFMGYGCGLVLGFSMGYIMFSTGKPKWIVGLVEGGIHIYGRRSKKHAHRHKATPRKGI